ncbi:M10 family metallopeptidase [Microvirga roseola]|uniref:M10 family metallopeptidase n=1 Tax=Microvirga roseola TaxID=2883126 RepID=UPI001E5EF05F|nr:M10 family metallopeptidase [Microvirga roseola]
MVGPVSVERTFNQDIDGLLSGLGWDVLDITYSFPTDTASYGDGYGNGELSANFQPLSADQADAARRAFGMISSVTNLTFTEIEEVGEVHADLRLASSDAPASAWTYLPEARQEGGDSWFRTSSGWFDELAPGGYAHYVFIHEIVHALGLKHGSETGGFGTMTAARDSMEYSVTTYRSYVGADGVHVENETWGYAQTLMMYDIAALQYMYGADFSTNSGGTTYGWDPVSGQAFVDGIGQGSPGANRVLMTVWDGGGNDTYDLSNYATNLIIDLRPGAWSTLSAAQLAHLGPAQVARGNVANALLYQGDTRSLIENATGGSGSDRLFGNEAANILKGRGGADRLSGREGQDTLFGGSGRDILTGGADKDTFAFDKKPNRKTNVDRINDFNVKDDTIQLENGVFAKIGKGGMLAGKAFWAGPKAHDKTDRVIHDRKSGILYYDADGTGKNDQIKFAKLDKGLKLKAGDFFVV